MTRFQLSLEADNLKRRLFRRPNPYAVVKVAGGPQEGMEIGRTSTLTSTTQPDWPDPLYVETDSSVYMPLKISIYGDYGIGEGNMLLAEATFEATEIFQSVGRMKFEKLRNGVTIYAVMEESIKGNTFGSVSMHLRGLDIKNVEPGVLGLGRTDPFFEISKKNADHAAGVVRWDVVYRSEHIFDHLNPFWKPFTLSMEQLCFCDPDWPLRITGFDWQRTGRHREIGHFETTLKGLQDNIAVRGNADRELAFEIMHEDQITSMGLIVVLQADIIQQP